MWLFTNFGFFSVVQKRGDNDLTIRSRVRGDLEQLRDRYVPTLGPIIEGGGTDYPYRAKATHAAFAEAAARIAKDIHYSNFKDSVAAKQGHERHRVYENVWGVLHELEDEERTSQ